MTTRQIITARRWEQWEKYIEIVDGEEKERYRLVSVKPKPMLGSMPKGKAPGDTSNWCSILEPHVRRLFALKNANLYENEMNQQIAYALRELVQEIACKYVYLTPEEVGLALETGVKGEFIDAHTPVTFKTTAVNAANMCHWLRCYVESRVRLEALQEAENDERALRAPKQLSVGDIESRNMAAFSKLEKDIRGAMKGGTIPPEFSDMICAKLYNHLRTYGRMEMPQKAAIDAAQDVARKFLKTELQVNCRAKRSLLEMYLGRTEPTTN